LRIVEPLGEQEQRGLARARGADDGDRFARLDGQREIDQRRAVRAAGIAERDLLERKRPARRAGQRDGPRRGRDVGLFEHEFVQAPGRARPAQKIAIDFGQRPA
jgi:hypothetical protein